MKNSKKFKKLLKTILIVASLIPGLVIKAQEQPEKSFRIYPSFGIGHGYFYPADVNEYVEDNLPYSVDWDYGDSEIYSFYDLHAGITFRGKIFDVSAIFEYDIAPKILLISGEDTQYYVYSRMAPGIVANLYIPTGAGKNALFIGGGINYSMMCFEDYTASSPGIKIQAGYSLQFTRFNLQPFAAFNHASGTDTDSWGDDFDLNYTNGQFGVNMSFHPRIYYK